MIVILVTVIPVLIRIDNSNNTGIIIISNNNTNHTDNNG